MLLFIGVGGSDQRERRRYERRTAEPHQRAGEDERCCRARERSIQRGEAELHCSEHQKPVPGDAIAGPASRNQEPTSTKP